MGGVPRKNLGEKTLNRQERANTHEGGDGESHHTTPLEKQG